MCNSRYYDAATILISIGIGIALSVLGLLGVLTVATVAPLLGAALGALALLLMTISGATLLRQNEQYNACQCRKSARLLLGALLLIAVSAFMLIFPVTAVVFLTILQFLLFSLMSYTFLTLYCLLRCVTRAGCGADPACATTR